MLKNKNKILYALYFLFIILLTLFLFFNDSGVMKYISLKNKNESLDTEIKQKEKDIKNLELEIDSLKNNAVKIEQVAREKYNMQRADEKAYKIEEK
ncbi:MAG: hypothetical protein A2068_11120 [Ignavibacteria bacterium GWB2_35_6b]|nr:MAG: hypothetical protein A2068_11120 [Ignavibacteria bacterium GWB2_35_6b]